MLKNILWPTAGIELTTSITPSSTALSVTSTNCAITDTQELPKISKCNRPNCGVCKPLITENEFIFQCEKTINVKTTMSCEVRNLIYVIRCGGCQEQHIGETGDTLRHSLTVHRQQIRDASTRMLYVSGHITNYAKNQSIKFKFLPLYKMLKW